MIDPTKEFVKLLNNTINNSAHLFNYTTLNSLKPINVQAPRLTGHQKIIKLTFVLVL